MSSNENGSVTVSPRPGDPEITPEVVADHGLSEDEYDRIYRIMGRTPTFTELGLSLIHI